MADEPVNTATTETAADEAGGTPRPSISEIKPIIGEFKPDADDIMPGADKEERSETDNSKADNKSKERKLSIAKTPSQAGESEALAAALNDQVLSTDSQSFRAGLKKSKSKELALKKESEEKVKRRLKAAAYAHGGVNWQKLFRFYDRDNSGEIAFNEFRSAIRKDAKITEQELTEDNVRLLFDAVDLDGDGQIQYGTEFLAWLDDGGSDQRNSEPTSKAQAQPGYFQKIIQHREQKKYEWTLDQCKQRLRAAAFDHMEGSTNWIKLFSKYDKDRSGTIEFEEFRKAIRIGAKVTHQILPEAALKDLFRSVDTDNSGVVNYEEEFLPWFEPSVDAADPEWKSKRFKHRNNLEGPTMVKLLMTEEKAEKERKTNILKQKLRAAAYSKGGINVKKLFYGCDRDDSGQINLSEFTLAVRKHAKVGKDQISPDLLKAIFKDIDKSRDGNIDFEAEFVPWLEAVELTPLSQSDSRGDLRARSPARRKRSPAHSAVDKAKEDKAKDGMQDQADKTKDSQKNPKTPRPDDRVFDSKLDQLIHMVKSQNDELQLMRQEHREELQRLRDEHESLLSCLDSVGVVPSRTFTNELRRIEKGNAVKTSDLTSTLGRSSFSSAVPASTPDAFSAGARSQSAPGIRSQLAPHGSSPSSPARARTPGTARRSRLESPGSPDLFNISQPLLIKKPGALVNKQMQRRALADVESYLRHNSSPGPDSWAGPATPLHGALEAASYDLFDQLIYSKADVNAKDDKGVSVLHQAVYKGQVDFVATLLSNTADPNLTDEHGQTPLFFAPSRNICELLFQHLADVNVVNSSGQSALHLAGIAGLAEVLVWLTKHVPRVLLDLKDSQGLTPADYARRSKRVPDSILRRLYQWNPVLIGRANNIQSSEAALFDFHHHGEEHA